MELEHEFNITILDEISPLKDTPRKLKNIKVVYEFTVDQIQEVVNLVYATENGISYEDAKTYLDSNPDVSEDFYYNMEDTIEEAIDQRYHKMINGYFFNDMMGLFFKGDK